MLEGFDVKDYILRIVLLVSNVPRYAGTMKHAENTQAHYNVISCSDIPELKF
jgi:hypothetical protein